MRRRLYPKKLFERPHRRTFLCRTPSHPPQLALPKPRTVMTDYELLRIISFLERMRAPFDETLRRPDPDPNWSMVLFLMRSYLRGENVLMSTLATTANVPAASAMRRIHRMIEDSEIDLRARSPSARTFYLEPSKRLRRRFSACAKKVTAPGSQQSLGVKKLGRISASAGSSSMSALTMRPASPSARSESAFRLPGPA